jgi:hypothetical protein
MYYDLLGIDFLTRKSRKSLAQISQEARQAIYTFDASHCLPLWEISAWGGSCAPPVEGGILVKSVCWYYLGLLSNTLYALAAINSFRSANSSRMLIKWIKSRQLSKDKSYFWSRRSHGNTIRSLGDTENL